MTLLIVVGLEEILLSGQVYFGEICHSDQGHNNHQKYYKPLVDLVSVPDARLTILEVGSWAGGSLLAWDEASGRTANLIAVDQWEYYASIDPSPMVDAVISGDIYRLFLHNMKVAGLVDRLTVHRGDSRQILRALQHSLEGAVDIVYIDGDHIYETVRSDIENAMPLIRDGGILVGDDLQIQLHEVNAEAHRVALEGRVNNQPYFQLNPDFGYHPGVTQAVSEIFGPVTKFESPLWAVQKYNGGWRPVALEDLV